MELKLKEPFLIGPRHVPALRLGNAAFLNLHSIVALRDRHIATVFILDTDGFSHTDDALAPAEFPCIAQAFNTYLTFLAAAGESLNYQERRMRSACTGLFPNYVVQWARDNLSFIQTVQLGLRDQHGRVLEDLITEKVGTP